MDCPHCHSSEILKVSTLWAHDSPGVAGAPAASLAKPALSTPNFPVKSPPSLPVFRVKRALFLMTLPASLLVAWLSAMAAHPGPVGLTAMAAVGAGLGWTGGALIHRRRLADYEVALKHWLGFFVCNGCGELGLADSFVVAEAAPSDAQPTSMPVVTRQRRPSSAAFALRPRPAP